MTITKKEFADIWGECEDDANDKGHLFINDWTEMCKALDQYSKENDLPIPQNGGSYGHPLQEAFIEGAKWGFKYGINKH